MRLFVALDLPAPILDSLERTVRVLKPAAPRISWSPVSNLHITTKFIGEWPEEKLRDLKTALEEIHRPGVIEVRVAGVGWFPNPHSPRVFWAAVKAPAALAELASATDRATATLGVPAESRAYHPHLTLARIKTAENLAPLRQAVAKLDKELEFGTFTARSYFLYLSEPKPSGAVYTKLAEFPLS